MNTESTILVVDDNPTNLNLLFEFLDSAGFTVLFAEDGKSTLERVKYIIPDIILLDIMMPGMDGYETCQRLKERDATKDIPIIFMTALTDTISKLKAFDLGAVDYITKPFQQEEVLARVNSHLTIQRLKINLQEKNDELAAMNQNLEKLVEEKTQQLFEQEKSAIVGRLLQGIVHNLKNPLSIIKFSNEMIERKIGEPVDPSVKKYFTNIHRTVAQMETMMDNLMVKSRLDHDEAPKLVNINDLLRRELDLLNAHLQFKHDVKKEFLFDETIPSINIVYANLSQVIENLIHNALDAMWQVEKKELLICTHHDQTHIYIDIKDNGCGIEADKIDRIFDPFYTSKPAKGEEKEGQPTGSGLGLHTCLELLKPFDGTIKVESDVGKGSTFTVVLPKFG